MFYLGNNQHILPPPTFHVPDQVRFTLSHYNQYPVTFDTMIYIALKKSLACTTHGFF